MTGTVEATRRSLRVMTYNIRGLHDDAAAVTEVLDESRPDVVAIQEPPRGPFGRRRLRRVAGAAGLEVAVQGGGARTTALLVRPDIPWVGGRAVRLPWRPGRTRRGMAIMDAAGLRLVSVHLGLSAEERARHLARVLAVVASAPAECVVAGDLNEGPGGPGRRRLALHLRDLTADEGPTYPAERPRQRIDAVLGSSGLRPTAARVVDGESVLRASDHRPVVVDLHW